MAAKPLDRFARHSQTWKYSNLWWYRQTFSLKGLLVLKKNNFEYYLIAFICYLHKARWPPYRASVQYANRKLESALGNDDMSEISAQMGHWFWRRRFLLIKLNFFENPIWRPRSRDRTWFYCQILQGRGHACYIRNFKVPRPLGLEKKLF